MTLPAASSLDHEFGLMPFWFWNDELDERELLRQIDDFASRGVGGFVIHPRMGLPRSIGWMSERLLHFMKFATDEAARRGLKVILYDEGMYPSGSSSGQVVREDPTLACRCLALLDDAAPLPNGANVVASLTTRSHGRLRVVDRPADSVIRGIHYLDEASIREEEPAAGDILNPRTAEIVLRLVYERFHDVLGEHFGKTILGVFTDEPDPLGRCREKGVMPGTTGIVGHVSRVLGYDFTPHLPALWFDDEPDASRHRRDYAHAIRRRLDETWYAPLSAWCERHGVALCGHPRDGDESAVQRYFHIPGQDIVWRFIEPDEPSALEGPQSTQGKVTSSAMLHLGRRRNSNEFAGAYGHELTFDEFRFLGHWLLVRGVNLLIPHAFYYSVRGPRRDERPPDVGPNSPWWDRFKPFADRCKQACWINTDSLPACEIAIACDPDHAPWRAARTLFEHQIDFNYLDVSMLDRVQRTPSGVTLGPCSYRVVLFETETPQPVRERLMRLGAIEASGAWLEQVRSTVQPIVRTSRPAPWLRARVVCKSGATWLMLFNESLKSHDVVVEGRDLSFGPADLKLIEIDPDGSWRM